jgi:hypothetical protein
MEKLLQEAFYVVRTMDISRQRVVKHIPAEAKARHNRTSIAGNGAVNRLGQQYRMCFLWIRHEAI